MDALQLPILEFHDVSKHLDFLCRDEVNFTKIAHLLKKIAGIDLPLNAKNKTLMAARLSPVMRRFGINGYSDLLKLIQTGNSQVMFEFITAMTTNTTEFFREKRHFELWGEMLPKYLQQKASQNDRDIRIWCAAASSGQEPYTIAMVLHENINQSLGLNVHFLATDIDRKVLEKAAKGVYTENEIQGVPPVLRPKYFESTNEKGAKYYRVSPLLRQMVHFAEFNLIATEYPFKYRFDFVFCRNVLIYFDRETCQLVSRKIGSVLKNNGVLFVGHSEVGIVKDPGMLSLASAVYQKKSV